MIYDAKWKMRSSMIKVGRKNMIECYHYMFLNEFKKKLTIQHPLTPSKNITFNEIPYQPPQ